MFDLNDVFLSPEQYAGINMPAVLGNIPLTILSIDTESNDLGNFPSANLFWPIGFIEPSTAFSIDNKMDDGFARTLDEHAVGSKRFGLSRDEVVDLTVPA